MTQRVVVDTNVIVSALLNAEGANRSLLRRCLLGTVEPVLGEALFLEYEDVLSRPVLMSKSPLSAAERRQLFEAFLSVCTWVNVYFRWRPNLRDEGDNHLIELAVAGGANWIITNNLADFRGAELRFPQLRVAHPGEYLKETLS